MRAWLLVGALLLVGCRGPGPNADERGKITYWLITSDEVANLSCSDSGLLDGFLQSPLPLGGGTVYYYIYKVANDGETAMDQDCQYDDYNNCTPNPKVVFQVKGHVLTATSEPQELPLSNGCTAVATFTARLEDKGGELDAVETVSFELTGSASGCEAAEAEVQRASSNGQGVRDCISQRKLHAAFSQVRTPGL